MIIETTVKDDELLKFLWLKDSTSLAMSMADEWYPVIGFTWFPLVDMYEWKYRAMSESDIEDFIARFGMITMGRRVRHIAFGHRDIIEKNNGRQCFTCLEKRRFYETRYSIVPYARYGCVSLCWRCKRGWIRWPD